MASFGCDNTVPQQQTEESVTLELPSSPAGNTFAATSEACAQLLACAQFVGQPEESMTLELTPQKVRFPGSSSCAAQSVAPVLVGRTENGSDESEAKIGIPLELPLPQVCLPDNTGSEAASVSLALDGFIDNGSKAKAKSGVVAAKKTIRKRPAAPEAGPKVSRAVIPARTCRSILQKLEGTGVLPVGEVRDLAKQAKRAVRSCKKSEQDRAGILLGHLLVKVSETFEAEARDAQREVEEARAAVEAGATAEAQAEALLNETRQVVLQCKEQLKEADKAIETESEAIADAKKEQKSIAVEVRTSAGWKRQLEETVENVYQPLKEARVHGPACAKQANYLSKVGKKQGFHRELLTVAPDVLKKQLDKRQTFDNLTLCSLESEFAKHIEALDAKIKHGECTLQEHKQTMQTKQTILVSAKSQHKESVRNLTHAEAAVRKNKGALLSTRRSIQSLPIALKKAESELQKAEIKVSKFRSGPVAAYTRVMPLPCAVASVDEA